MAFTDAELFPVAMMRACCLSSGGTEMALSCGCAGRTSILPDRLAGFCMIGCKGGIASTLWKSPLFPE